MKDQKRRKKRSNFILSFAIVFTFVVLFGIFGIMYYQWVYVEKETSLSLQSSADREASSSDLNTASGGGEESGRFKPVVEPIPVSEEIIQVSDETAQEKGRYDDILQNITYMEENNIYIKEAEDEERITITFAGDILFDPNYRIMATLLQNGGNIENAISADLLAEMRSADIMMINNEFPYSNRGEPLEDKAFTFRAAPSSVSYLHDMGVDIVSLANNHAYDHGEDALLDTFTTLKEAGIPYVGAGVNEAEAVRPVYYIINDMKIAFLSATQIERLDNPDTKAATENSPGVFRCWNGEKLLQAVREAKEQSDFVIVYVHWGTENVVETDWAQEKQAPELAEAGADLVIGDHPHILQRIGVANDTPVMYSLGNFWFSSKTLDTGMVKVTLTEDGLESFQFIPCLQNGCRTSLLYGEEKERVLSMMRDISVGVTIDADGYVTW